jgi:hypothetical protein
LKRFVLFDFSFNKFDRKELEIDVFDGYLSENLEKDSKEKMTNYLWILLRRREKRKRHLCFNWYKEIIENLLDKWKDRSIDFISEFNMFLKFSLSENDLIVDERINKKVLIKTSEWNKTMIEEGIEDHQWKRRRIKMLQILFRLKYISII